MIIKRDIELEQNDLGEVILGLHLRYKQRKAALTRQIKSGKVRQSEAAMELADVNRLIERLTNTWKEMEEEHKKIKGA